MRISHNAPFAAGTALLAVAAAVATVAGCSGSSTSRLATSSGGGSMSLNTLSAKDVGAAIDTAGLPRPNAHDVTDTRCAQLHCLGAIDSDTVSIVKFADSGPAQLYAGGITDSYIVEDIVLVFTPRVPTADRAGYEHAVERAAQP